jgi:hypothetical protein
LPSGEKAACSSLPGKLVTGIILRRGARGIDVGRKIKNQTPMATIAPKAKKKMGKPS